MSRRYAEIWSHPGHYLIGTNLVTMVMNDLLPPPSFNVNQPSHSEVTAIHGQGHVCGQRSRSHKTLKIQRSRSWPRSNLVVTFEALSSIDMFAFRFVEIQTTFWLRYSKFHIWPWKFKVKVMAKMKLDGHIWGLEFNRCVCSSFRGNQTIFGWDIANSIFDLENSRSRSR